MSAPRTVLFVISEDWFFVSHFLHVARALVADGYVVVVHLHVNSARDRVLIEQAGVRIVEGNFKRGRSGAGDIARQIVGLREVCRRESPLIVHAISLRMVVLGGLAATLARVPIRVYALTGLGLMGSARDAKTRFAFGLMKGILRLILNGRRDAFIFENHDDAEALGLGQDGDRAIVVGGAGIDPTVDTVLPLPHEPPLKLAIVSRMVFSKGVAVAVEAFRIARKAGVDIRLTLVGAPDPGNPRSLTRQQLEAWSQVDGIEWLGRVEDVRGVWRDHHVACVPSLGGEGLPRSLLEAAAAGRPIITTDTAGCSTFVRHNIEGLVVPPGDAHALAAAFAFIAGHASDRRRMGDAARTRVLHGFTTGDVTEAIRSLYDRMAFHVAGGTAGGGRLRDAPSG